MERLQEEHQKAIEASKARLEKWKTFDLDYKTVQEQLNTLPLKLTHNVMVPISNVGYMIGELYHTNEILVLLGDNWFVKRTSRQASEIIDRRRSYIKEETSKEEQYLVEMSSRYSLTDNLQTLEQDVVEIKEEYDPVKENEWKLNRKKRISANNTKGIQTDEEIWQRLDELEIEEMQYTSEGDDNTDNTDNTVIISFTHTQQQSETHSTSEHESSTERSETHSASEHESSTERSETHSTSEHESSTERSETHSTYQSPGDIYDRHQYLNLSNETVNTTAATKSVQWDTPISPQQKHAHTPVLHQAMPFSGFVVERNDPLHTVQINKSDNVQLQKVSKFKASKSK